MNAPSSKNPGQPPLSVVFAPDYCDVGPYQTLLAESLADENVRVDFLGTYRRFMPLWRGLRGVPMDLLHMHFPVHYMLKGRRGDFLRKLRFIPDLWLATRRVPLVYTVHDLFPLDERVDFFLDAATRFLLRRANALIVHSEVAREVVVREFGIPPEECTVIPHGDLSVSHGLPVERNKARAALGLGDEKICLAFGSQSQSKGTAELLAFWKKHRPPATLAVVGRTLSRDYANELESLAANEPRVLLNLGFQSDEQVRLWFSAADCIVINYRTIFTSGVCSLARSYGLPIVLPIRHATVDLQEPHSHVFRFDSLENGFGEKLAAALDCRPDFNAGADWRAATAWDGIARQTRLVYERALGR